MPYEPGTSPELSAIVEDTARAPITIDVDDFSGPVAVTGDQRLLGGTAAEGVTMLVTEPPLLLLLEGQTAPFSYAPAVIAPAQGQPQAWVTLEYPKLDGFCRSSHFSRSGASSTPFAFHVESLAEAKLVRAAAGPSSATRPGERAPHIYGFSDPGTVWVVHEDRNSPPLPAVFRAARRAARRRSPRRPASRSPTVSRIAQRDEIATYADALAGNLPSESTQRSRTRYNLPRLSQASASAKSSAARDERNASDASQTPADAGEQSLGIQPR